MMPLEVASMNSKKEREQVRLARIAKELTPGCEPFFDPQGMPDCIRMRVNDSKTEEIHASEYSRVDSEKIEKAQNRVEPKPGEGKI